MRPTYISPQPWWPSYEKPFAEGSPCQGRSLRSRWLEPAPTQVPHDLRSQLGALLVGGAEVDAGPDPRVDDLLERVGQAPEAAHGRALVAVGREGDAVGAEEGLQRTDKGGRPAGVAGWV